MKSFKNFLQEKYHSNKDKGGTDWDKVSGKSRDNKDVVIFVGFETRDKRYLLSKSMDKFIEIKKGTTGRIKKDELDDMYTPAIKKLISVAWSKVFLKASEVNVHDDIKIKQTDYSKILRPISADTSDDIELDFKSGEFTYKDDTYEAHIWNNYEIEAYITSDASTGTNNMDDAGTI